MWYELRTFSEHIKVIEELLFELAAHSDELKAFGLRYVLSIINFKDSLPVLDSFSSKLTLCLKIAPLINRQTSDRLKTLLSETNIEDLITQLTVRLKIAERERPRPIVQGFAAYTSIFRRIFQKYEQTSLFSDNSIPLESVLAALSRLKVIIGSLEEEQYRKTLNDDEIFKPSNVNVDLIVDQIEKAIEAIDSCYDITPPEKERLIVYLSEAKSELAEKTPVWKKVVGALIICATLLSGVAAAPTAIDNLNSAIKHILGTSIEKSIPNILPKALLPAKDKEDYKEDD